MGEIDAAVEVEASLEVGPRDVLGPVCDQALSEISKAQQKAGELRVSLATAMRIVEPNTRFRRLLKLAAIPPRP